MFIALEQDILPGHVQPLDQFNKEMSVVNHEGEISLMSNVCPHQNAKILKEIGSELRCPYHGLTYNIDGTGQGHRYCLRKKLLFNAAGICFDQQVFYKFPVDLAGMQLKEYRAEIVKASADIIMDVFLDIDHIPHAHAGVYDRISINSVDNIELDFFSNGNAQHVIQNNQLRACWMAVYPGTMIEWQPGALFVTVCCAVDTKTTQVLVYKYAELNTDDCMYDLNSEVWETAWRQDKELAENIVALPQHDLNPLKKHFHSWLGHAVQ